MTSSATPIERVLAVLLDAARDGRDAWLGTHLVAERAGIPTHGMVHTIPALADRGWLDPLCPPGTLKLSADGIQAARKVTGMP